MALAETNERKVKICTLLAHALCYSTHSTGLSVHSVYRKGI